jgi:phospholipid/cholesterol/gamma-HCH transport system substrate-binding protein
MANDLRISMSYLKKSSKKTSESISNLNILIASLNNKDNVVGILKDTAVANSIRAIVNNLDDTSVEINKAVTNVNKTILNIKDGKGALNYLSNDPVLVQRIDSTMINVNEASVRLNENLEALKHNFLFRRYFRKLEREKLREQKR